MPELTLIAKTVAKPDAVETVRAELAKLVAPTHREDGCLEYVMHHSLSDPAVFVFVERWASKAHLEAHLQTAHFQAFLAATEGLVDDIVLDELEKDG